MARRESTSFVWSGVSVAASESRRVSFSGWSATEVVRDDQPGRAFALDEPGLELAVLALLDRLVADAPLGEQAAHEVGGEVALEPGRLEEDEEAVAERLGPVGERALAHRREQVVGLLGEEVEHALDRPRLARRATGP